MLPNFSSLFSKKEPAGKGSPVPPAPVPQSAPPEQPKTPVPSSHPIPRPGQMGVTRVLPTPPPQGVRAPLRAPLPPSSPIDPARNKKRITQRITVNVPPPTVDSGEAVPGKLVIPGMKAFSEFQPQKTEALGSIQIPLHVILKSLPSQILSPEAKKFIDTPEAGALVPVPLATVLAMLPSGKLEFPVKEFLPLLPGSVLQPMDAGAVELQMVFSLPLPDIFKLIPSEYVTKRRDQKPIDPRVMSMADPFSESELRKKAEIARQPEMPMASPSEPTSVSPLPAELKAEEVTFSPTPQEPPRVEVSPDSVNVAVEESAAETASAEPVPMEEVPEPSPQDLMTLLAKANQEAEGQVPEVPLPEPQEEVVSEVEMTTEASSAEGKGDADEISSGKEEEGVPADFASAIRQLDVEQEQLAKEPEIEGDKIQDAAPAVTESVNEPEILSESPQSEPEVIPSQEIPEPVKIPVVKIAPPKAEVSGLDINSCGVQDIVEVGCPESVARKILAWRELHGPIQDIRRIRGIPGVTSEIYRGIVGLPDPGSLVNRELNEAFGLSPDAKLTVKDVASCIRRWPYVVACIIGGMEGLPIAYDGEDSKYADLISAFVPKLFQQTNSILEEVEESKTQEIHLVKDGRSLSIYCCRHLFLVTVNLRKDAGGRESDLIREVVLRLSELKESKFKT